MDIIGLIIIRDVLVLSPSVLKSESKEFVTYVEESENYPMASKAKKKKNTLLC